MINHIFDLCVVFLLWLAKILGISYEAVNVWIFCIIWPLFTLWLMWMVCKQRRVIKELQQKK